MVSGSIHVHVLVFGDLGQQLLQVTSPPWPLWPASPQHGMPGWRRLAVTAGALRHAKPPPSCCKAIRPTPRAHWCQARPATGALPCCTSASRTPRARGCPPVLHHGCPRRCRHPLPVSAEEAVAVVSHLPSWSSAGCCGRLAGCGRGAISSAFVMPPRCVASGRMAAPAV